MRRFPVSSVLIVLATAVAGCTPSATRPAGGDHAHERPDHHPGTLSAAVPAIRQRAERLTRNGADTARDELTDIFRWLPQLAADSELKRAAWEEVATLAAQGNARIGDPKAVAVEVAADLTAIAERLAAIVATLPADPGEEP